MPPRDTAVVIANRRCLESPRILSNLQAADGFLDRPLKPRKGSRPVVQGIVPQRQISQKGDQRTYAYIIGFWKKLALESDNLIVGVSASEKHGMALFCRQQRAPRTDDGPISDCREICHAHEVDGGSVHIDLHPADAGEIISKGWGERHPLARDDYRWFVQHIPRGYVLFYCPTDPEAFDVLERITRAAIRWNAGDTI